MIHFNFPEEYESNISGIISFKDNFWVVGVTRLGNFHSLKFHSLLVRQDGEVNKIEVAFSYKSRWDRSYGNSGAWDMIVCEGKLDQLNHFGFEFEKRKTYQGVEFGVIYEDGKVLDPSTVLRIHGVNGWDIHNLENSDCICSVMWDFCFTNSVPGKIASGLLPENPGIGFRRGNGAPILINPDETKKWEFACLSSDELTCLAIHNSGGCIFDNPV